MHKVQQCVNPLKLNGIADLSSLKSLSRYLDVKSEIENALDIKLGVRGWNGLFEKIKHGRLGWSLRKPSFLQPSAGFR